MPLKRLLPTVAIVGFLLGALAVAVLAGPLWHVGNLAPAAVAAKASPSASASPNARAAKAQAACDAFLQDFAGKLGVTPQKVQSSFKAALKDAVDRAVTNGKLTSDQATKAKARIDAAQGCAGLGSGGRGFGGFGGFGHGGPGGFPGKHRHGSQASPAPSPSASAAIR